MNEAPLQAALSWISSFIGDRRIRLALCLLVAITALGTLGFAVIEGMAPFDALYMTVITLSTVGYGEVQALSVPGRWFTIGLITLGVGAVLQAGSAIAGFVIEGRLRELLGRKSMQRNIDTLSQHVIVCGFGRLGQAVSELLGTTDVVVIDLDEDRQKTAEEMGFLFIHGTALEESVLRAAGVERARALIAATANDPDNVFISLSARELKPEIRIHARAESAAGVRRLKLAGASQVISPHHLAGQRIANAILRPGVVEFLELSNPGTGAEIDLEEVELAASSNMDGIAIRELRARGLSISVIAIKRNDEPIEMHPSPDTVVRGGDHIIAVGDRANLARLAEAVRSD